VNHEVYDEARLQATMTMDQRSLNRMKKREKEADQKRRGEQESMDQQIQNINRIKFGRWETEIDRKYNPIKNEVELDRQAPLPERPATMWARLTANNNSFEAMPHSHTAANTMNFTLAQSRYQEKFPGYFKESIGPNAFTNSVEMGSKFDMSNSIDPFTRTGTGRPRDLSGAGLATGRQTSHGEFTSRQTGRQKPSMTSTSYARTQSTPTLIPALDVSKVDYGEPVSYQVPSSGLNIPIVRTSGFSVR
jgi:hypothetical protein